jgi:hypothetical protein
VLWHDPTDPLVSQLHLQAGSVQNIRLMVPVVLEPESPSYARWRDLLLLTLHCYALDDHVLCDPTGMAPTAAWVRLDSIVLTWIVGTISVDLHSLLQNLPHARAAWLAIEGQFLGNAEARALRLDAAFRIFVQGDLSVSEYCRKMKTMANSLGDLGGPVEDRMLVLNVLCGLIDRYTHLLFVGSQPRFTSLPGFTFASPSPWRPGPRRLPLPRGPRRRLLHRPGWLVGDAAALAAFQTPTLAPLMGSRVDRGHRCYLPHHSQPRYTHLCSSSFFLSSFVHHGGEWLMSSCHICGCRRPSRLFSYSRCSCRSFFGPQSSFYSPFYC